VCFLRFHGQIRDNYYRSGEGFIFVFALNDTSSLQAIPLFYTQLRRAIDFAPCPPCLLLGNKSDLSRGVEPSEIERVLKGIPNVAYLETSAKANANVNEAFSKLICLIEGEREKVPSASEKGKKRPSKCKRKTFKCIIN
jgi:Ras-related protein Ral-A